MSAHDLYTQTLSGYKSRLSSFPTLTLLSYCREKHVNYPGMNVWLSRHGISIRELKPSVSKPLPTEPEAVFSRLLPASTPSAPCSSDMLYGITITFPDGAIVSIKQGSSLGVNRFIDRYNSKTQEVQLCLR